jgi:rubrerythrin
MVSKLNAMTIMAGENQTHDFYMTIGPMFSDPTARQLYAEIASIEEQHVTQYESLLDPTQTLLEQWLLHEANEVYNYYSCMEYESNPEIKDIWERFCNYELGHFHHVAELLQKFEKRDAQEIVPNIMVDPIRYESHREYVRKVLREEVSFRADGTEILDGDKLPKDHRSNQYAEQLNSEGSPSETAAAGYIWVPGTELVVA